MAFSGIIRPYKAFQKHYKALWILGSLDPVDWRPREYNKAADHVANCVLEAQCDVDTLTVAKMPQDLTKVVAVI